MHWQRMEALTNQQAQIKQQTVKLPVEHHPSQAHVLKTLQTTRLKPVALYTSNNLKTP